jgi:uncharacterized protein YjeT (DUF2065 family)
MSKTFGSPKMWRAFVEVVAAVTDTHCRRAGGWTSQFGS